MGVFAAECSGRSGHDHLAVVTIEHLASRSFPDGVSLLASDCCCLKSVTSSRRVVVRDFAAS